MISFYISLKYIDIKGEFSNVKMYKCSNIFGIVGSNVNPDLSQKELIIWDDKNQTIIYKYRLKKDIINFELTEDNIIVVCYSIIYIFNIKNFQLIDIIKTGPNPKGLVGVSHEKIKLIVYPSTEENNGKLTIKNYNLKNYLYLNPDEYDIDYFTLSYDGLFLATYSKPSKKIRIYQATTGKCLDELFKDKEKENIKCLSFSTNSNFIFFAKKKDNIDIWSLVKSRKEINEELDENLTNIHGGFFTKKEKPFNQVNLMEKKVNFEYELITFGQKHNLFVVTSNGKLNKVIFEMKKGGHSTVVEQNNLF